MSGGKHTPRTPFVCRHQDPRCKDDPCPLGIARTLCNAPDDHPSRATGDRPEKGEQQ